MLAEPNGTKLDGFLAHEAKAVVPAAVLGDKDETFSDGSINPQQMDNSKIVPLLTAALQEAVALVEALAARVAALEARNAAF
jgi:hypothetical protein